MIYIHPINLEVSWNHVKEIPNTELLCSLNHEYSSRGIIKIFDVSQKVQQREIFSTEVIEGGKTSFIYYSF